MLASVGVIGVPTVPSTAVGGGVFSGVPPLSVAAAETEAVNGAKLYV